MAKKIGKGDIIGERGIAFIRRVVLDMGHMFYETGGVEAGIDGFIELRDEASGEVSNLLLQVQGKASDRRFPGEDEHSFEWPCDQNDIDYWFHGTAPVLLIVVRPNDDVAYWKSIKDYFRDPAALQSKKVVFDKRADLFSKEAKSAISLVASGVRPGLTSPPPRLHERLLLNLLPVTRTARRIFWAPTSLGTNKIFGAALRAVAPQAPGEWIVKGGAVLSFHDLSEFPWTRVCDAGAMEEFDTSEWSLSDDPDRQRDFVQLLNRSLRQMIHEDLRHDKESGCYFFKKLRDRDRRAYSYRALETDSARNVVWLYTKKKAPNERAYYRHSAFLGRFLRFEDQWYLEVTPTYHFTWDGIRPDLFGGERLKKIKEYENNEAVMGQFVMWRHYLVRRSEGDMITPDYPFLGFDQLPDFNVDRGVPDQLWLVQEPKRAPDLFSDEVPE